MSLLRALTINILAALGALGCGAAGAETPEEFFRGKTVTIHLGLSAGGNYDLYGRFLAEFMSKHIPGNPAIVVQNRPGAGSRTAAAHIYSVAPKDGLHMGLTLNMLPLFQVLDGKAARYDMTKVNWIGNMVDLVSAISIWHTAPAITLDGAKQKEVILGSTGQSSETYIVPIMMNAVIGTKFKVVTGYPGTNEINLALERGEVHGRGASWANIALQRPEWVREKKIIPIIQIGYKKLPELGNLPLLIDLAGNEEERRLLDVVSSVGHFSRALYLPPDVPAERVRALRRAFDAAMTDAAFLESAKARNIDIEPQTGEEVQKTAARVVDLSDDLVEKLRGILKLGPN